MKNIKTKDDPEFKFDDGDDDNSMLAAMLPDSVTKTYRKSFQCWCFCGIRKFCTETTSFHSNRTKNHKLLSCIYTLTSILIKVQGKVEIYQMQELLYWDYLMSLKQTQILHMLVCCHYNLRSILIKFQDKVDIYQKQVQVFKICFMKEKIGTFSLRVLSLSFLIL